jgi:hypothetical protein
MTLRRARSLWNNPGAAQAARDLAVVSEDRERSDA